MRRKFAVVVQRHRVVTKLQSLWRKVLPQRRFHKHKRKVLAEKSATLIQATWRSVGPCRVFAKHKDDVAFENHLQQVTERKSSTRIQAFWRGVKPRSTWRAHQTKKFKKVGATKLQAAWRRFALRQPFLVHWKRHVDLQAKRWNNASKIQATWRTVGPKRALQQYRRQMAEKRNATRIQSRWRGVVQRKQLQAMSKQKRRILKQSKASIIQGAWRHVKRERARRLLRDKALRKTVTRLAITAALQVLQGLQVRKMQEEAMVAVKTGNGQDDPEDEFADDDFEADSGSENGGEAVNPTNAEAVTTAGDDSNAVKSALSTGDASTFGDDFDTDDNATEHSAKADEAGAPSNFSFGDASTFEDDFDTDDNATEVSAKTDGQRVTSAAASVGTFDEEFADDFDSEDTESTSASRRSASRLPVRAFVWSF